MEERWDINVKKKMSTVTGQWTWTENVHIQISPLAWNDRQYSLRQVYPLGLNSGVCKMGMIASSQMDGWCCCTLQQKTSVLCIYMTYPELHAINECIAQSHRDIC